MTCEFAFDLVDNLLLLFLFNGSARLSRPDFGGANGLSACAVSSIKMCLAWTCSSSFLLWFPYALLSFDDVYSQTGFDNVADLAGFSAKSLLKLGHHLTRSKPTKNRRLLTCFHRLENSAASFPKSSPDELSSRHLLPSPAFASDRAQGVSPHKHQSPRRGFHFPPTVLSVGLCKQASMIKHDLQRTPRCCLTGATPSVSEQHLA